MNYLLAIAVGAITLLGSSLALAEPKFCKLGFERYPEFENACQAVVHAHPKLGPGDGEEMGLAWACRDERRGHRSYIGGCAGEDSFIVPGVLMVKMDRSMVFRHTDKTEYTVDGVPPFYFEVGPYQCCYQLKAE